MKKSSLLLSAVFLVFLSHLALSQDTLKTAARSWTAEINVNPFQGQISLNNAVNQIKVRYFTSNNFAYRFAFSLNNIKKDNTETSAYGTNPVDNSDKKSSTSFGLNLGFEKHFTGTRRLSPYIGGEIAFGLKNAKETLDTKQSTTEIKGAWQNTQVVQYYNNGTYYYTTVNTSEQGYQSIVINIVTGFDFYVAKHFLVGYEMLFGFNYIKYDNIETTYTPKPGQPAITASNPKQGANERSFGPKIINGIRLGYTF